MTSPPSPELVKSTLQEVLSQRQFVLAPHESFLRKWVKHLMEQLSSIPTIKFLLEFLGAVLDAIFSHPITWYVLGGVIALLVLAIIYYVVTVIRSNRAAEIGGSRSVRINRLPTPEAQEQEAYALASSGNYLGAIKALYFSLILTLHQHKLLQYQPSKTNWEFEAELRKQPRARLSILFRPVNALYDLKCYGLEPCGPDDFKRFSEFRGECLEALRAG